MWKTRILPFSRHMKLSNSPVFCHIAKPQSSFTPRNSQRFDYGFIGRNMFWVGSRTELPITMSTNLEPQRERTKVWKKWKIGPSGKLGSTHLSSRDPRLESKSPNFISLKEHFPLGRTNSQSPKSQQRPNMSRINPQWLC